jgi:hypothetical protein
VQHIDLPAGKRIAFVTFKNAESAAQAIGKSFVIKGDTVSAEERRRNPVARASQEKKFNGDGFKNGSGGAGFQRGRGQKYQQNRPPQKN